MSAFVRRPDQLFLEPVDVARSIGIRVLLVALLGFPARLFNSTVKANRATIVAFLSRWAGPLRVLAPVAGGGCSASRPPPWWRPPSCTGTSILGSRGV